VTPQASACQIFDGAATCPTGTTTTSWYTGYTGNETCGACTCGNPSGASCANAVLSLGSDYTCAGTSNVGSGQHVCFTGTTGVYHPGASFTGSTTAGTCQASSAPGGTLAPTGRKTVCCL
jgi:hypothetical protein